MALAKTIVILSIKGGVGKTFLAANLAAALTKDRNVRALLADLDYQVVGDMGRMLDLSPKKTMLDIITEIKAAKKDIVLGDFVAKHSSGMDFLSGIARPQQAHQVEPSHIKAVFDILRPNYDYIIVDAGRGFTDLMLSILNEANLVLLVANPDVLSINQVKVLINTLQSMLIPVNMIKVVLNRSESLSSIGLHEIQAALKSEIITQIPSEGKVVMEAVNRGLPVSMVNARSKVSKTIDSFANKLISDSSIFIEHQDFSAAEKGDKTSGKINKFWQKIGMAEPVASPTVVSEIDKMIMLKTRIHKRLIAELNLKKLDIKAFSDAAKEELRKKAGNLVSNLLAEESGKFISSGEARRALVEDILDEALGLGPLEALLSDSEITDIMVNNRNEVYVERKGKLELTPKKFTSNAHVKTTIERIIAPIGRRIDESVPMVDARLPDGSRVNAIIPPLALTGPTLTIRKFRKERFTVEELVDLDSLSSPMGEFIKACVLSRKNIIVSGGTGSGKTTVLNVLSTFVPSSERIVTIEDAAELKLTQDHWVRLESRPPNIEGKGAVIIRDLFRNSLRMRPDRILIGECRGIETLDMLQAMNTGHDGSMTTVHANSTHDVLTRLDSMILMSGIELPIRAIREMIASAVHVIVHTARLSDGSRRVLQVTEITGMLDEMHIGLKDIFAFYQTGVDEKGKVLGEFKPTGHIPSFYAELKTRGIIIPEEVFKP